MGITTIVKNSELEEQYTKLFNWAGWPEEPPAINFGEKTCWIFGEYVPDNKKCSEMGPELS